MGVCQPVRLKTRHMTPSMRVGLLELMLTISVMLSPAFAQPEAPSSVVTNYKPITERERLEWFLVSTTGPSSLFGAGPLSAGLSTAFNNPEEYGPHWEGFGKRYGMRLTGVYTGNAIEATLGTAWGEDPRYFPSPNHAFGARVKYIIKTTFLAPRRDGRWRLAYAHFIPLCRQMDRRSVAVHVVARFFDGQNLIRISTNLFSSTLSRQSLFHAFLLAWLQVVGVTFHFLNYVFRLNLALEPTQGSLQRLTLLQSNFCQTDHPKRVLTEQI